MLDALFNNVHAAPPATAHHNIRSGSAVLPCAMALWHGCLQKVEVKHHVSIGTGPEAALLLAAPSWSGTCAGLACPRCCLRRHQWIHKSRTKPHAALQSGQDWTLVGHSLQSQQGCCHTNCHGGSSSNNPMVVPRSYRTAREVLRGSRCRDVDAMIPCLWRTCLTVGVGREAVPFTFPHTSGEMSLRRPRRAMLWCASGAII
jgi:hypothetical protein